MHGGTCILDIWLQNHQKMHLVLGTMSNMERITIQIMIPIIIIEDHRMNGPDRGIVPMEVDGDSFEAFAEHVAALVRAHIVEYPASSLIEVVQYITTLVQHNLDEPMDTSEHTT